jgi:hypothetical protein
MRSAVGQRCQRSELRGVIAVGLVHSIHLLASSCEWVSCNSAIAIVLFRPSQPNRTSSDGKTSAHLAMRRAGMAQVRVRSLAALRYDGTLRCAIRKPYGLPGSPLIGRTTASALQCKTVGVEGMNISKDGMFAEVSLRCPVVAARTPVSSNEPELRLLIDIGDV